MVKNCGENFWMGKLRRKKGRNENEGKDKKKEES
jgi:hypothetical protein